MDKKRQALTHAQELAITELLTTSCMKDVSKKLNIPYSTLKFWLYEDPLFVRELRRAKQEIRRGVSNKITIATTEAVEALIGLLKHKRASIVFKAAKALLDLDQRGYESDTLQEQLEELRRKMESSHESSDDPDRIEDPAEGMESSGKETTNEELLDHPDSSTDSSEPSAPL